MTSCMGPKYLCDLKLEESSMSDPMQCLAVNGVEKLEPTSNSGLHAQHPALLERISAPVHRSSRPTVGVLIKQCTSRGNIVLACR